MTSPARSPRLGEPRTIGELLRARVTDEQRIPCSVGIGPSKFIAKLASKQAKPDGLVEVPSDLITAFLHPLPVEAIWGGAGHRVPAAQVGLTSIDDVAHTPKPTSVPSALVRVRCCTTGPGDATRSIQATEPEHSIGAQTTSGRDTDDPRAVHGELLRMAARASSRMRCC